MPIVQPSNKIPFVGADNPSEVLPERDPKAERLAKLEQENRQLRDDLRHVQSALASAVGL